MEENLILTIIMVLIIGIIMVAAIYFILNFFVKKEDKNEKIKQQQRMNQTERTIHQETITNQTTRTIPQEIITHQQNEIYPYHKKYLLTKNEYYFYKRLASITNPIGLQILAKIRLADLIETNSNLTYSQQSTYFNKIKAKHIDFAIADNMKILLLIELDDSSHLKNNVKERDNFVNNALIKAGYTIIRTKGEINIISKALIDQGYNVAV